MSNVRRYGLNDGLKKTTVTHCKGNWRCDSVAFDVNDVVEHPNLMFKGDPDAMQNRTKMEMHVDPLCGQNVECLDEMFKMT